MSGRILVVEDQEDLRAILCDYLSAYGYTVIEAVDGTESIAKAASEKMEKPRGRPLDKKRPIQGYSSQRMDVVQLT
jgi:CheY-like chemotaxis protein